MANYIVKVGVYLQGVYGPYDTRDEAIAAFNTAYESAGEDNLQFDGHHDYYIIQEFPKEIGSGIDWGKDMIPHAAKPPYN